MLYGVVIIIKLQMNEFERERKRRRNRHRERKSVDGVGRAYAYTMHGCFFFKKKQGRKIMSTKPAMENRMTKGYVVRYKFAIIVQHRMRRNKQETKEN